jgi:hypothetical protein
MVNKKGTDEFDRISKEMELKGHKVNQYFSEVFERIYRVLFIGLDFLQTLQKLLQHRKMELGNFGGLTVSLKF